MVNLVAAWVLAALSAVIIGVGLIGFIGPELVHTIPPPAFPGNSAGTLIVLGIAISSAGVLAAPLLLRGYGLLASSMLAPAGKAALALRVQQLTETRTEALDTGATEIRRIERDLHDGAQARLVAMGMTLDAAGQIIDTNPDAARALLYEARDASVKALAELRNLVRGIHPPVLADRGLADAIRALALDSPMRIHLASDLTGRPPAPVESAAYFAVSELLANVSKHAEARQTWVDIRHTDGDAADRRHRQRPRRRRPGPRHRAARDRAAAGRFRRRARGQQPAGRTDGGNHGDPVRVVIAEDLFLLRDGLTRMLQAHGLQIAAAVDNGADLLAAVTAEQPDVAIVDVRLPPTFTDEGIRAALAARREVPGLPVLVLSQYVEQLYARELLASGSGGIGYLLKDRVFDSGQFVDAVRRVAAGGTAMDPEVIARLLARNTGDGNAGRGEPARTRGARPDGRGPVQRRHRPAAGHHRTRRGQAHRLHLRQAGPAAVRRRQPPGARRPRLPGRLTAPGASAVSAVITPDIAPNPPRAAATRRAMRCTAGVHKISPAAQTGCAVFQPRTRGCPDDHGTAARRDLAAGATLAPAAPPLVPPPAAPEQTAPAHRPHPAPAAAAAAPTHGSSAPGSAGCGWRWRSSPSSCCSC